MMVTPYDDERVFVTLQPDHARVAGYLAAHWGNEGFDAPQPYTSFVLAAQEHDHGWWRYECKPTLSSAGQPLDYHGGTLQHLGQQRLDLYAQWTEDLGLVDPYAALLVNLHLCGLLNGGFGRVAAHPDLREDPRVRRHLERQARSRERLHELLAADSALSPYLSSAWLEQNFMLLEAVDQLAQLLCNRYPLTNTARQKPTMGLGGIAVPRGCGRQSTAMTVQVQGASVAVIEPFPFDRPLRVSFEGRMLPRRPYVDRAAFLRDFYRAERLMVQVELVATIGGDRAGSER